MELPKLKNPFVDSEPLRASEVKAIKPVLMEALEEAATQADRVISDTNRRRQHVIIWSNMDQEELETLADYMLSRGVQNKAAAAVVRGVVQVWSDIEVMVILGPRLWDTFMAYRNNGGFSVWE